jgi:glycogen operon protein
MDESNWGEHFAKSLGVFLNGKGIRSLGPHGEKILDDSFYILFNAHYESLLFNLPASKWGDKWKKILDTAAGWHEADSIMLKAGAQLMVAERSLVLLQRIDD